MNTQHSDFPLIPEETIEAVSDFVQMNRDIVRPALFEAVKKMTATKLYDDYTAETHRAVNVLTQIIEILDEPKKNTGGGISEEQ